MSEVFLVPASLVNELGASKRRKLFQSNVGNKRKDPKENTKKKLAEAERLKWTKAEQDATLKEKEKVWNSKRAVKDEELAKRNKLDAMADRQRKVAQSMEEKKRTAKEKKDSDLRASQEMKESMAAQAARNLAEKKASAMKRKKNKGKANSRRELRWFEGNS